jgi:ABC-type Na+ efflux pump permease subunit
MANTVDTNRITTDLVVKLFDTLKESNSHLKSSVEKQTEAILHLTSFMKEGVKPDELKKIIETHDSNAAGAITTLKDIDTCTETIQDKSNIILTLIEGLSKKVTTMITIVCIAFSLMVVSYIFVSNSMDKMVFEKITKVMETKMPATDKNTKNILTEIENIRKEMERLHSGDKR